MSKSATAAASDPLTEVDLSTAQDVITARDLLKRFVKSFEPDLYSGEDAKKLVKLFSEVKHIATSGVMLAARRVEQTHAHEQEGHKTAGTLLANLTDESVGSAVSMLEMAKSIEAHPAIDEAFRSGKLSEQKARQIASAADARPDQAQNLLDAAAQMEAGGLRRHCADVCQSARSEDDSVDHYEQMRKKRYCRIWSDQDGFGRVEARITGDALAVLRSCIEPFEKQVFDEARIQGRHDPQQVYAADALIAMVKASRDGKGSGDGSENGSGNGSDTHRRPEILMRVRVDLPALKRGRTIPGETCSIPGIGPLPVALVRQILGDSLLELVITEGQDVRAVVTNSRHIRRALQIALEERDPTCCVPGCEMSDPLETDHRTDFAKGGPTSLDNLARLCPFHHDLKTYKHWKLEGGPGNWRFERPDPPGSQHPEHRDQRVSEQSGDPRSTGPPGQSTLL